MLKYRPVIWTVTGQTGLGETLEFEVNLLGSSHVGMVTDPSQAPDRVMLS